VHLLPARELVRPNMRRSAAFPAPQALVGTDMQRIFALFAAQVAARSESRSTEESAGARGQHRPLRPGPLGTRPAAGGLASWRLALRVLRFGQPNSRGRDGTVHATQRAGWAPKGPGRRALRQCGPDSASRPPDGSATQRSEPLRDWTSPGDTAVRTIGSSESRPRPASTGSDL